MTRRSCNVRGKSKTRPAKPKCNWASTRILPLAPLKPPLPDTATLPYHQTWERSPAEPVPGCSSSAKSLPQKPDCPPHEACMDLSAELGRITLKNPLICASSEFTMTAAGIKAALNAGAAAVIAKSVNESPAAARQLDSADYVLLDRNWNVVPWEKTNPEHDSLFCRSGLAKTSLKEWLKLLAELDQYAQTKNSYVVGSITVADPGPAA